MYDIYSHIQTRSQVEEFCHTLFFDMKLNANPDEDFSTYVNVETGAKALSQKGSSAINTRFAECFEVVGEDIYEICFALLNQAMAS